MANVIYTGISAESFEVSQKTPINRPLSVGQVPPRVWPAKIGFPLETSGVGAVLISNGYTRRPISTYGGVRADNYATDTVRGSISFDLSEIKLSVITEDITRTLLIWNGYEEIKSITNISATKQDGTTISPSAYPIGIPNGGYAEFTFLVDEVGTPSQNTMYTFTIGSETFETAITGMRVLPFLFPINWEEGFKLTLLHNTVITTNKVQREQRRPLQNRMFKSISVNVLLDTVDKQNAFLNWELTSKNAIMGLPLYQEALFPSTELGAGVGMFTVSEDVGDYKFLNESPFLILIDYTTNTGEIKKIESINTETNQIILEETINTNFDRNTTIIYPITFVTVAGDKHQLITDHTSSVSLEFNEFKQEM